MSASGPLRPTKYGTFEASLEIGNMEEVVSEFVGSKETNRGQLRGSSLVLGSGQSCEFQVQWTKSERPSFSMVGGHLMTDLIRGSPEILPEYLRILKALVPVVKPVYGDIRSMATEGWDAPWNLALRLPDIPYVSIYGPPYVSLFGDRAIESAPFLCVEKLDEGFYWLEAAESVFTAVPEERKAAIRAHFGEEAFMAGLKWRYVTGKAPVFNFPRVEPAGVHREI